MPPKARFTCDEVVDAAFELVRQGGVEALSARSLADKLGSSPRPIFTLFKNMEEVQSEVNARARALYSEYSARGMEDPLPFKGVGTQYILFAMREPNLFSVLFMTAPANAQSIAGTLSMMDDSYGKILLSIQRIYGLDEIASMKLYHHLWIYCHGVATLCATRMCRFSGKEISIMLSELVGSLIDKLKPEAAARS